MQLWTVKIRRHCENSGTVKADCEFKCEQQNKGIASNRVSKKLTLSTLGSVKQCTRTSSQHFWCVHEAWAQDIPANGLLLRKLVKQIAIALGHDYVSFSNGCLDRFKVRHAMTFMQVCSEWDNVSLDIISEACLFESQNSPTARSMLTKCQLTRLPTRRHGWSKTS